MLSSKPKQLEQRALICGSLLAALVWNNPIADAQQTSKSNKSPVTFEMQKKLSLGSHKVGVTADAKRPNSPESTAPATTVQPVSPPFSTSRKPATMSSMKSLPPTEITQPPSKDTEDSVIVKSKTQINFSSVLTPLDSEQKPVARVLGGAPSTSNPMSLTSGDQSVTRNDRSSVPAGPTRKAVPQTQPRLITSNNSELNPALLGSRPEVTGQSVYAEHAGILDSTEAITGVDTKVATETKSQISTSSDSVKNPQLSAPPTSGTRSLDSRVADVLANVQPNDIPVKQETPISSPETNSALASVAEPPTARSIDLPPTEVGSSAKTVLNASPASPSNPFNVPWQVPTLGEELQQRRLKEFVAPVPDSDIGIATLPPGGHPVSANAKPAPAVQADPNATLSTQPTPTPVQPLVQLSNEPNIQSPSQTPVQPLVQPLNALSIEDSDLTAEDKVYTLVNNRLRAIPFWQTKSLMPMLERPEDSCEVELEQLIGLSMQYSPKVQAILTIPKIKRAAVGIEQAEFDPRSFASTKYHGTSDPIGSTLTTGGPKRLEEKFWENSIGMRDKNVYGGKAEWSQIVNARDNNSLFFQPHKQADTKWTLNYTQPLMKGSGRSYNTASIAIAGLQVNQSISAANRDLQEHAFDIVQEYWDLVLNRYKLRQVIDGKERIMQIRELMLRRREKDLIMANIHRADGVIHGFNKNIATIKAAIQKNESKLKQLVNAPSLTNAECKELIPLTVPIDEMVSVDLEQERLEALQSRGDILALQSAIAQAARQKQVAVQELQPTLDMVASTYVHGLRGNYDAGGAWADQFGNGRPSYTAGLDYQRPNGNQAAKNNLQGRIQEMQKQIKEYEEALNKAHSEIAIAVAEAQGYFDATKSALEATLSALEEVNDLKKDFTDAFDGKKTISTILDDLLNAEKRLIEAEQQWADSQIAYMVKLSNIKFASGTLLAIRPE